MATPTLADLKSAIRDLLVARLPASWTTDHADDCVIWARQDAPRPKNKHLALRLQDLRQVGASVHGAQDGDGDRPRLATEEITLEVQAYGEGGLQVLKDLRGSLDTAATIDELVAASLCVVDPGSLRDLTSLYDSQFKERAVWEIRLRSHALYVEDDAESAGILEAAELELQTQVTPGVDDDVRTVAVDTTP